MVVNDSHWQMRNLRAEDLDPRARLVIGDKPLSMTQGVGEGPDGAFDAAAFIGYHAGAGHRTGVIAHTYSSATVMDVRVNGAAQRGGLNAIRLGHYGVPVILVAATTRWPARWRRCCPGRSAWSSSAGSGYRRRLVVAGHAAGGDRARACGQRIGRLDEMQRYEPAMPLHGEVDFRLPIQADYAAVLPGGRRIGRGRSASAPRRGRLLPALRGPLPACRHAATAETGSRWRSASDAVCAT